MGEQIPRDRGVSSGPLLTVVTVVKDDPLGFERTKNQLLMQRTLPGEWLVVSSSQEAEDIDDVPRETELHVTFLQTPAAGVYAAMNAGLSVASGSYVMFHNAGDELDGSEALSEVCTALERSHPTWLYGDVTFIGNAGVPRPARTFTYARERQRRFAGGLFPSQASTVVSTPTLRELGGFDESYAIAADYKAMLLLSEMATPEYLPSSLVRFSDGGLSSTEWRRSLREARRARREVYGLSSAGALADGLRSLPWSARTAGARVSLRWPAATGRRGQKRPDGVAGV